MDIYRKAKVADSSGNKEKAFLLYKESADKGNAWGQYRTAQLLTSGKGTDKNPELAQEYYQKALAGFIIQNNENRASWLEYKIGTMFEKGQGTVADSASAFRFYETAADNGHPMAMYKVGRAYLYGSGVNQDEMTAQKYFRRAYSSFITQEQMTPNSHTEYVLGNMCEKGWGTEKNINEAKGWYQKSAEKENGQAAESLAQIEHRQTSQVQSSILSLIQAVAWQLQQNSISQQQSRHNNIDRKQQKQIQKLKHEIGIKD